MSSAYPIGWPSGQLVSGAFPAITKPIESLPGYKESIIDYANRIETLFGKMDSLYNNPEVLPLNRGSISNYFDFVWKFIHALITPVLRLQSEPKDFENFRSYIEEEEARLGNSLKRVHFIIDGVDTLTLITGAGRIEKVSTSQLAQCYP
jgi:hypothetical protein